MTDASKHPEPTDRMKPKNQTDESNGVIKGAQRTDGNTSVTDTARGSEPATNSASHRRVSDQ